MSNRNLTENPKLARRGLLRAINQQIADDSARRECERSLLAYTHAGWRWAGEPSRFVDNWHIECMCEHLEAVANRQILRLLINLPPRHYIAWPQRVHSVGLFRLFLFQCSLPTA